jgi:ketosteroid isomerase-like protein
MLLRRPTSAESRSYASAFALKDGRAISVTEYVDHAEALEVAGLRE